MRGLKGSAALVVALSLGFGFSGVAAAQNQQTPVPDAPTPQAPPPLPGADGPIVPGGGTQPIPASSSSTTPAVPAPAQPAPTPEPASAQPPAEDHFQNATPDSSEAALQKYVVNVNFVEVPVTVKDSKGKAVAGLTFRDFKVFENVTREPISFFSVDPQPLSIAFVIDQSLPSNVMAKVNTSLGALQGALAPYDEVAVFSYAHGTKEWTTFTGGQSNRLPAVLSLAQNTGTDPTVPFNSGPFANCSMTENGNCVDPNLQQGRSAGNGTFITLAKGTSPAQRRHFAGGARALDPAQRIQARYLRGLRRQGVRQQSHMEGSRPLPADKQDCRLRNAGGRLGALGRGLARPLPPALRDVLEHSVQVHGA